ncbi:class I SAM-dependent methyltransferase [Dechloromonas sp. HYN0024]|uniref:class I SAM-dependent methyltransferase n=1 Tax=Dechloromonas sp. HYN0024 TaxID=2231055 RepID=UPI0013C34066|nr:class I SAM-dependent methyltransferase [Dechloromonas sp. HYN0024]
MLEIGIQNGGSLELWSKYFGNALQLIGCDINRDCSLLLYSDKRINVVIGDANDIETYRKILLCSSEFDIVIDDGSHRSSDIIKSFCVFFPLLASGGVYIVEDLHCSYWDKFEGGLFNPYSSISFFKRLVDVVNYEHWGVNKNQVDILSGIFYKYGCNMDSRMLSQINSIEFVNSMCVIRKAPASDNTLGSCVMGGSVEIVAPGHEKFRGTKYNISEEMDQSSNPWSAREKPPDELIEIVESELIVAVAENDKIKDLLRQREIELDLLYQSTSWKITAPVRAARRLFGLINDRLYRIRLR